MVDSIYEWLLNDDDATFSPEQRLWISVVMQAAIDSASSHKRIKKGVIDWMRSEDFNVVCGMAGMSHIRVRDDINAILAAATPKESFRLAMSFRFLIRSHIENNLGESDKAKHNEKDPLPLGKQS